MVRLRSGTPATRRGRRRGPPRTRTAMSHRLREYAPTVRRGLRVVVAAVLAVVVLASVAHAVPALVGAEDSFIVTSNSMSPAIEVGDVIYVYHADAADVEEGDVISFVAGATENRVRTDRVTTHRVVEIQTEDGRQFITKGDANENRDPDPVDGNSVVGRVPDVFGVPLHAPLLGRLLLLAGSTYGIVALVFVPVTLLIGTELYGLARAAGALDDRPGDADADAGAGETEEG